MKYKREVAIPVLASEFEVTIVFDGIGQEGLLHVARTGGMLHPAEFLYFQNGIATEPPIKPHQDGEYSWDANFGEPSYIKRMRFVGYNETQTAEDRAADFANAVKEITRGRIIVK